MVWGRSGIKESEGGDVMVQRFRRGGGDEMVGVSRGKEVKSQQENREKKKKKGTGGI